MADAPQCIPGNAPKDGKNQRKPIKSVKSPTNPTVNNPGVCEILLHDDDHRVVGLDKAPNKLPPSKHKKELSVSTKDVPKQGGGLEQLTSFIKKLDPNNTSGAVKPALDILDKFLKQGINSPLSSIPNIMGSLQGLLQQSMSQAAKENQQQQSPPQCPIGQVFDTVKQICVPICPAGQIFDANNQVCIIDTSNPANLTS